MKAIPARSMRPPTASTSWLPAGPATPTMLAFEVNCWVTVTAIAGLSCVSPCTSAILVPLAALSIATASSAKCSCSVPSGATGPVIGPSNPTDATHDFVLADPPAAAALLLLLLPLLLLLLQPATASEPTAAAARTRRPFIWIRLHFPRYSHNVGVPISEGCRMPRHAFEDAQKRPPRW